MENKKTEFHKDLLDILKKNIQEECKWRAIAFSSEKNSRNKIYVYARSTVLDIHQCYDTMVTAAIGYMLVVGAQILNISVCRHVEEIVGRIEYGKRSTMISQFTFFKDKSLNAMKEINRIRNAFVHNMKFDDDKFKYFGISIFTIESINKAIDDLHDAFDEGGQVIVKDINDRIITQISNLKPILKPKEGLPSK